MARASRLPAIGSPCVAVIIAAFNAERTVGAAVRSALSEPETAEVVVVDDGSQDRTAAAAQACDDGSGRLAVVRQGNAGPSAARNRGVQISTSPLWCVLDADDCFAAGRFARLFDTLGFDWDMAADAVQYEGSDGRRHGISSPLTAGHALSLSEFVLRNVPRRNAPRSELGFLQPLKRRAFFERRGLWFDPALRFAEDYALYAQALAAGARFVCCGQVGYIAYERSGSLSGSQSAEDFERLIAIDRALLPGRTPAERRALEQHMRVMKHKAQYLRVQAAIASGAPLAALRHGLRDHRTAKFMFDNLYRWRLSRAAKRMLGLKPDHEWRT
jgi:succinoglycan biosynthesis protein ExoU